MESRLTFPRRPLAQALGASVLVGALLVWLHVALLDEWLGGAPSVQLFLVAALVGAALGGLLPGLLATLLAALASAWFVMPPRHTFLVSRPADIVVLLFLVFVGVTGSLLFELLHRQREALAKRTARDLQERLRASSEITRLNEELRARIGELETLQLVFPAPVFFGNADCSVITANRFGYELLGLPPGSNVSSTAARVPFRVEHEGRPMAGEDLPMQLAARTGRPVFGLEHELLFEDGRRVSLTANVQPLFDEQGRVRGVIGAYADLTGRKRAEEELRRSEERLSRALASSRMAVIDWDLATGVVTRSPNVPEIFGVPLPAEGPADDAFRFMHPDDVERARQAIRDALEEGASVRTDYRFVRADGTPTWAEMRGRILRDASGRPARLSAVIVDINERKAIEEALRRSEERMRSMLRNTPLGVVQWDPDLRITNWSGAATEIFGWTAADVLGRHYRDLPLVEEEDLPLVDDVSVRMLDRAQPYVISRNRNRTKDGRTIHCVWYNSCFFDAEGRMESALSLVLDETDRVTADRRNEELVEALRERASELAEADRRKDEFLALLAHELRNPLAPIRNGLEVLRRAPLPDARAATLEMIERQVAHMIRLVDDLLDSSRLRTGKLRLERVPADLAGIVRWSVATMTPRAEAAGVGLREEERDGGPFLVWGDEARLSQIVLNLLDNGLKFTPRGGSVTATVARDGDGVTLRVSDTGVGIPAERLEEIFESFVQVDGSIERTHGGLGLGLTLVRALVELHGGRVSAESEGVGRGSTFAVRLPRAREDVRTAEPAPAPAEGAGAPLRILVVDDSADAASSLAMFLALLGHDVGTAADGKSALEACGRLHPDLVLCDLGMPGMSGLDVARELRSRCGADAPFLVALTGYGTERDRESTRAAGFDEHFVKPVDVPALERLLARLAPRGRGVSAPPSPGP